jgi:hypothetical protein
MYKCVFFAAGNGYLNIMMSFGLQSELYQNVLKRINKAYGTQVMET